MISTELRTGELAKSPAYENIRSIYETKLTCRYAKILQCPLAGLSGHTTSLSTDNEKE